MIKAYDKNIESSYLKYWDVNNWFGWVMSQKLPVDGFKRILKKTSQFNVLQKSTTKIFCSSWCSISWKITWPSQ